VEVQLQWQVHRQAGMKTGVERIVAITNRQGVIASFAQGELPPLQQEPIALIKVTVGDQFETAQRAVDKATGAAAFNGHVTEKRPGF
jgi:hypothetical protein